MSGDTIKRDAKLADAIDAIGEESPEAKARILSGEVRLNKNQLHGLSDGPKDDIIVAATRIREGTLERKRTEKDFAVPDSDGKTASEAEKSLNAVFIIITDDFLSNLRKPEVHDSRNEN